MIFKTPRVQPFAPAIGSSSTPFPASCKACSNADLSSLHAAFDLERFILQLLSFDLMVIWRRQSERERDNDVSTDRMRRVDMHCAEDRDRAASAGVTACKMWLTRPIKVLISTHSNLICHVVMRLYLQCVKFINNLVDGILIIILAQPPFGRLFGNPLCRGCYS